MQDFENRVALVTGSSGIGRACAVRLASGGARVMVLGIDPAANRELLQIAKDRDLAILVRTTDVSVADEVGAAIVDTIRAYGRLDIIVNAAAIHPYGTSVTTDPDTFIRCLSVNVGSIYLTAHFGVPEMEKGGGGAIVNISSVQGHACQPGVAAYVASKGAIHSLTRAMALDHAPQKIRVNSVSPGSVRTPILELAARTFDGPDADIEDAFRRFGAAHPIGRIGEPQEVAEMVAYLASDRAAFCTGSDFIIDGGLTAAIGVK